MEAFTFYFIRSIAELREPVQPFFNNNLIELSLDKKNESVSSNVKGFLKKKINESIWSIIKGAKENDDIDNLK